MNGSRQEKVVLAETGDIHYPITVDIVSVIIKGLCCSLGIPLNVFVAFTIIQSRRMLRKPRNFFLLAIILSHLSFFISPVIELIYWGLYPVELVCQAYVTVLTVPQGFLLTNMLLALTERYLAINYPALLHRREMTTRLAAGFIITTSMVTVFLVKFVYIVQLGILRCEVWLVHVKMYFMILIFLFASCIVLNVIIYRQTKTLLRECRTFQTTQDERDPSKGRAPVKNLSIVFNPTCTHAAMAKLSQQMEMEATRTLMIEMSSLCVMPCLALILIASYFACRLVGGQASCSHFVSMEPLVKGLSLTPAVYGPIIFLMRNKELRAAWECNIVG